MFFYSWKTHTNKMGTIGSWKIE